MGRRRGQGHVGVPQASLPGTPARRCCPTRKATTRFPCPAYSSRIRRYARPSMKPSSPSPLRPAAGRGGSCGSAARTCGAAWNVAFGPTLWCILASLPAPTAVPGQLWLAGFASPAACDSYLWPGNRSYTGQPVAEVHTFGSPPLLEAVVRAACSGGARPAEPGEFTLRAFLAGRIDLTQAEAVLGVIDATGPAELDAALEQLAGGLAVPLRLLARTTSWNCWPTWKPVWISPTRICRSSRADELLRQLDRGCRRSRSARQETRLSRRGGRAGPRGARRSARMPARAASSMPWRAAREPSSPISPARPATISRPTWISTA